MLKKSMLLIAAVSAMFLIGCTQENGVSVAPTDGTTSASSISANGIDDGIVQTVLAKGDNNHSYCFNVCDAGGGHYYLYYKRQVASTSSTDVTSWNQEEHSNWRNLRDVTSITPMTVAASGNSSQKLHVFLINSSGQIIYRYVNEGSSQNGDGWTSWQTIPGNYFAKPPLIAQPEGSDKIRIYFNNGNYGNRVNYFTGARTISSWTFTQPECPDLVRNFDVYKKPSDGNRVFAVHTNSDIVYFREEPSSSWGQLSGSFRLTGKIDIVNSTLAFAQRADGVYEIKKVSSSLWVRGSIPITTCTGGFAADANTEVVYLASYDGDFNDQRVNFNYRWLTQSSWYFAQGQQTPAKIKAGYALQKKLTLTSYRYPDGNLAFVGMFNTFGIGNPSVEKWFFDLWQVENSDFTAYWKNLGGHYIVPIP